MKKVAQIVEIRMVKKGNMKFKGNISGPKDVVKITKGLFKGMDRETFVVLGLNNQNMPVVVNVVAIGSLDLTVVHPREIMKPLILSNSASFICAHNHPSGNTKPSEADIAVTKRIEQAGKFMGILLLDHVIIGEDEDFESMKELGCIEKS